MFGAIAAELASTGEPSWDIESMSITRPDAIDRLYPGATAAAAALAHTR